MNAFFNRRSLNIDISNKCGLECLRCQRQFEYRDRGLPIPGGDITIKQFNKITDFFEEIIFCGQYSDPIHHPKFIQLLKICHNKNIEVQVRTASSARNEAWYIEAWKANPDPQWIFGIDGLPWQSFLYRINQDGEYLFEIMLKSKKYLNTTPRWQYIIFSYNEDKIEEAKKIANDHDLIITFVYSSRWFKHDDYLKPKKQENRLKRFS